jgi:hypothetical protein
MKLRAVAVALVTLLVTLGLGAASRVPFTPKDADQSILRMSWRLRGEKLETCRQRTEAELAKLPVHMRTPRECVSELLSYRLIIRIDGNAADTVRFAPAGAKADRPIFVLHDVMLQPGAHDVEVTFTAENSRKHSVLRYSSSIELRRGQIALLTLSPNAGELVLRH